MSKSVAGSENQDAKGPSSQGKLVLRMLKLVWRYRWNCIGVLLLQLTLMGLALVGLSLVGVGIDYVRYAAGLRFGMADGALPKPPGWPFGLHPPAAWPAGAILLTVTSLILTMAAVRSLLNYVYSVAVAKLVQARVVVDLRAAVYNKLQNLSFRFFDANASGSIINRVTSDVQMVRMFVDQVVMQTVIMAISLTVYVIYMVNIHVGLTLACLATTPLLILATFTFSRIVRPAYRQNRDLTDDLVLSVAENAQGVQVVKGFFRHAAEIARFRTRNDAVCEHKNRIFRIVSIYSPAVGFLTHINLLVLLCYGGYLVIRYEQTADVAEALRVGLSIGQFIVFSGLLQQFSGQVANIANIANNMQQSLTGAERVFEILDAPVEIQSAPDARKPERIRGDVSFEGVHFAYREGEPVLQDVSFHVPAGMCVAILGATGAGKSSLLSLVPRFYDPQAGVVRIDGIHARELDLDTLRRSIGIVFQESFLFSNTIAANIAFGHPDATREQIERAARIASAHDFIMAMPRGYDTVLAEGGVSLSGGQRQRLAIARALILEPPILLLDDPTAAIDPQTEEEILAAMEQAMAGRTTFLVTHRVSTLRRADWVVVLSKGRVAQAGTHTELMRQEGEYRWMADIQAPDAASRRELDRGNGNSEAGQAARGDARPPGAIAGIRDPETS